MTYQTTIGWSILTSGIVTILLWAVPGDSLYWGIGMLVLGLVILIVRRDDVSEAFSKLSGP